MAGNLVSLMAVSCSTSRRTTPEARPAHFHHTNYTNRDAVCPKCGVHQDRSQKKQKECLFCGCDLQIKRGRRPKMNSLNIRDYNI